MLLLKFELIPFSLSFKKNQHIPIRVMKKISCLFIILCFYINISFAQQQSYFKVKVSFKNGHNVKGAKATIDNQSISFLENGQEKTYPLADISLVEARKGSTVRWALGCGIGSLAISAITIATNDPSRSNIYKSSLVAGAGVLTILAVGTGILIGQLTDKYKPVYTSNSTFLSNRFNIKLTSSKVTRYNPTNYGLAMTFTL